MQGMGAPTVAVQEVASTSQEEKQARQGPQTQVGGSSRTESPLAARPPNCPPSKALPPPPEARMSTCTPSKRDPRHLHLPTTVGCRSGKSQGPCRKARRMGRGGNADRPHKSLRYVRHPREAGEVQLYDAKHKAKHRCRLMNVKLHIDTIQINKSIIPHGFNPAAAIASKQHAPAATQTGASEDKTPRNPRNRRSRAFRGT